MEMSRAAAERERNAEDQGRARQRRRTRRAILRAATELMAAGGTPTVAEIAEAAEVSKRTVYLYFPTREQLVLDAAVGMLGTQSVDEALARPGGAEERAAVLARALTELPLEIERAGRSLIALTVADAPEVPSPPRRGYRRVGWIEQALEPVRGRLTEPAFERLVTAVAMVTGFEAVIVQRDLRGLDPAAGADVSEWAARALVRAALQEAEEGPSPPA
jgi:AcrR family transcriptional regulator